MGSIGFYITIVLFGAGAAFGLNHKGEPFPGLASGQKKLLAFLGSVFVVCILLLLYLATMTESSLSQ